MSSHFRVVEHVLSCSHTREYVGATFHGDEDESPKIAVKQYVPLNTGEPQPGDVTIIAAHANGFPKEIYEPLWDDIQEVARHHGFRIRSIWIADCWNQGRSGVINEQILGNDPSWVDHARDLMNLINQRQSEMPHPLIGIGHSMGATQLALLALMHPRLLRSLIFIDPVIQSRNGSISPAIASTRRRDLWPSRSQVVEKLNRNRFYQSWDPRVLQMWHRYGLRPLPSDLYPSDDMNDQRVTLSTSKHQELFTFLRPTYREIPHETYNDIDPDQRQHHPDYPFYRPEPAQVFRRLGELRPSILYIFGDKSELSPTFEREQKTTKTGTGVGGSGGAPANRVKQIVLDCGHLVPMEQPRDCAENVVKFLGSEIERWRNEKREVQKYYASIPRHSRITIDERWSQNIDPENKKPAGNKHFSDKSRI